jgi:hypothetical protein
LAPSIVEDGVNLKSLKNVLKRYELLILIGNKVRPNSIRSGLYCVLKVFVLVLLGQRTESQGKILPIRFFPARQPRQWRL